MAQVRLGPVPITAVRRSFSGASYLLGQIGQIMGISPDLKAVSLTLTNRSCRLPTF